MNLLASTRTLMERVEHLTGFPVHLAEDSKLPMLARMDIGRPDAPLNYLRYRPNPALPPDYPIAFQCALAIRVYEAPPEKRLALVASEAAPRKVEELLADPSLPAYQPGYGKFLLDGILTQIRSIPVELRIAQWIAKEYPELADLQRANTLEQLDTNAKLLGGNLKSIVPSKVYRANVAMNAAFALFWSKGWQDPTVVVPYKATGFLERGEKLLRIFDRIDPAPACDLQLVDEWAFELGFKDWYRWVPRP